MEENEEVSGNGIAENESIENKEASEVNPEDMSAAASESADSEENSAKNTQANLSESAASAAEGETAVEYYSEDAQQVPAEKSASVNKSADGTFTKSIDEILHDSMIPYSEYVIMDRAIPRVEDGLKPVQRRVLYTMLELGLTPDKPFRKSARIVGDCLGKYHPHGDTSVYDAMVRMAQPHNMREILVTGHGNFGSNDGDSAAAMRYTEARIAPLAMELLRDLEKNTVTWSLNFDDHLREPDILPGRFPNLLVNGASGIAVGLATNIPPHNLGEVIDGVVAFIDNRKITLQGLMKFIKGPDFPTGGFVIPEELEKAYETGKGKILLRAKYFIEPDPKTEKKNIIITELPYQVNKAKLLQAIAELRENKKDILGGISDIRDESDRNGMRAIIAVKKDADAQKIMDYLVKHSDLQYSFGINMVAIAGGKPKLLSLREIIEYYVNYQQQVVLRRSKFELEEAKERAHILEGLLIAIKNIDEVIRIIKKSSSPAEAKFKLREKFFLTDKQAQAILDMRLARLTNLEVNKIEEELKELKIKIERLTAIIHSSRLQLQTVKDELMTVRKNFATKRKSAFAEQLQEEPAEIPPMVQEKPATDIYLALTAEGNLKAIDKKTFDSADKSFNENSKLSQVHTQVLSTKTNKQILAFTNKGYSIKFEASIIKECRFREKGTASRTTFNDLSMDEYIIALFEAENFDTCKRNLLFFTAEGMVKKTAWAEYGLIKSYFQAIKLKETDEVIKIQWDKPTNDMMFVTEKGMILFAEKNDVPLQGRVAGGVKGVSLNTGDKVIGAEQATDEGEVVIVTDTGFGKRLILAQIDKLPRYRKGLKALTLSGEAGSKVIYAKYVTLPVMFVAAGDETSFARLTDDVPILLRTAKPVSIVKYKKKVKLSKGYLYKISSKA